MAKLKLAFQVVQAAVLSAAYGMAFGVAVIVGMARVGYLHGAESGEILGHRFSSDR